MIKSMTGFGRATYETATLNITVEVKSLNSKFLDIYCRVPRSYSDKEIEVRNLVTQRLERGKVELMLNIAPISEANAGTILNRSLVKAYFRDLHQTSTELGFEPVPTELLRMALLMPNVYMTDAPSDEHQAQEWNDILGVINEAINRCEAFRIQEGQMLEKVFVEAIQNIENLLKEVQSIDNERIPNVRERLQKAVQEMKNSENFDQNRFEQELIFYVEKLDISEEKQRLANHLKYFVETLKVSSNGKKLNFIAQEIGREINTIGSKANDADLQRVVVKMKDELEKIKEQAANVI